MVTINPGTGPVSGATIENAEVCMRQFIEDVGLPGVTYEFVKVSLALETVGTWPDISFVDGAPDGRFEFLLRRGDQTCPVNMPGLPVDKVRFLGKPQNIWDFPRLYVNEGSWVWKYGVGVAQRSLSPEDEEESE